MKLEQKTIPKLHNLIKARKVSITEVTQYFLKRIEKKEPDIKAFLMVDKEVLKEAQELDKNLSQKEKIALLLGIPGGVKDNILIQGKQATAGSKILKDYVASYDATAIKKLKEQGTLFLGKTNLDEFGMGSSTENSAFFETKNPWDLKRVAGGSSGGSAAAVASGECLFALGTDTGGSVRQPASFCGTVGLRPTYGSVSRSGLIALASSLDVIGPIAKTAREVFEVFNIISGKDKLDSTSFEDYDVLPPKEVLKQNPKKFKIGIPKEYFSDKLESGIKKNINETIDGLEKRGFKVKQISLPHTEYALAAYYIIMPSEASANLARYDGLRYGNKAKSPKKDLIDSYIKTRTEKFGDEVRRRIILGVYSLSSGYYEDYYLCAQRMRRLIQEEFNQTFKEVDLLLTPTTPTPAFKIGEKISPLEMYFSDIFTVPVSLAGLPALSLPCGKSKGLPVGLQIIGKPFREEDIFVLANYLERILKNQE